jgi:Holliday junction DNA helicase RuvA
MRLLGFSRAEERDWFRLLTVVQGVGTKVALAILSALELDELQRALANGDHAMIARANGVGPKLAQRICNELKDKAAGLAGIAGSGPAGGVGGKTKGGNNAFADALSALASLGFKPAEASTAVAAAAEELGADATLDALVRLALKKAAK